MAVARTQLRQDAQLAPSLTYQDRLAPGLASLQTASDSTEYDFNALRSIAALHADTSGNTRWYEQPPAGLKQLNTAVVAQQQQPFGVNAWNYTAISVPANQNFIVLSASGGQAPSGPLAVAATSFGAVTVASQAQGSAFAANELTQLPGSDLLHPRNRIRITNNTDGSPIEAADTNDIFGLLQVESTAQDGATANDTVGGNRVKISFVKVDYATKQFVPAAVADVGGKTINYMYKRRTPLQQVPENGLGGDGAWVDNIGAADVTLQRSVTNQGGMPVAVAAPVQLQLASGTGFKVQSASGGQDYLAVQASGGSSSAAVNVTSYQVVTQSPGQFSQGLQVAQTTTPVNVGVTAGQVDAAGLTVASSGTNPLKLQAGAQVSFRDGFVGQSTFTSGAVQLANSATEWTNYKTYYGEASLAAALVQALKSTNHRLVYADVLPAVVPAGTTLTGAGPNANLSAQFPAYDTVTDVMTNVKLLYNGVLLRPGVNQAAGQDWFPGANRANGEVVLNFLVRGVAGLPNNKNDELALEVFGMV